VKNIKKLFHTYLKSENNKNVNMLYLVTSIRWNMIVYNLQNKTFFYCFKFCDCIIHIPIKDGGETLKSGANLENNEEEAT